MDPLSGINHIHGFYPTGAHEVKNITSPVVTDGFVSGSSLNPGIINPKQIGSLDPAVAAVAFTDKRPGVSKIWDIDLGPKGNSGGFPKPVFRDDGIYLSRNGTTRKYDYDGHKVWETPTTGWDYSISVFDDKGNQYLLGEKNLVSLDPDGNERWSYPIGKRSTTHVPVVAGDRVYVVGADCKAVCYDTDGNHKWTLEDDRIRHDTPFVDKNGNLFLHTEGGVIQRLHMMIDSKQAEQTGKPVLKTVCQEAISQPGVVDDNGTVYRFLVGEFRAKDINGHEKWSVKIPGDVTFTSMVVPKLGPDGNIYVSIPDRGLYSFTPEGEERWKIDNLPQGQAMSANLAWGKDGTLYVSGRGNDHHLYAINPDGTPKWTSQPENTELKELKTGPDGKVFAAGYDGSVKVFNPDTGEKLYRAGGGENCFHRFSVTDNGDIVGVTTGGNLVRFHNSTKEEFVREVAEEAVKEQENAPTVDQRENSVDIDGATLKKRKKKFGYLRL